MDRKGTPAAKSKVLRPVAKPQKSPEKRVTRSRAIKPLQIQKKFIEDAPADQDGEEVHSPMRFPKSTLMRLKVPCKEENLNRKNRYRNKKQLTQLRQKFEKKREWKKFKCYQEEVIFNKNMLHLEQLYRQSQILEQQ